MSGDRTELERRAMAKLDELLALGSAEREAALEGLALEDPAVAEELAALLAADPQTTRAFAGAVGRAASSLSDDREAAARPLHLGDYRVLGLLGRGGMGEVYRGERADGQFEQRVAIKLLKRGMDSEEILQRFLRERRILAQLTHPGVARLLDGGIAADGRPYFVLEEVQGRPITEYAQHAGLDIPSRLGLFLHVCDAVESAHQRFIVHRDLKPSNILVTDEGQVKLLDFGIAKVLGDTGEPALTRTQLRIMTPGYAAPEQILGQPATTATDVYSLGVVLFELLTGVRPHDRSATSAGGLVADLQKETLQRPSTVPSTPAPFRRGLQGDLDTIVVTALATEPSRRYATVSAFAADLRRFLEGRPIQARPATWSYQTGKFLRRHKIGVATTTLAVLALLAGLGVSVWQGGRARRAAVRAERTQSFLVSLLRAGDPSSGGSKDVTVGQLLDAAAPKLERDLAAEPEVRASLEDALAQIYRGLGRFEDGMAQVEKALAERRRRFGPDSPEVGWSLISRAELELETGEGAAALATVEEAAAKLGDLAAEDAEKILRVEELRLAIFSEVGQFDDALAETDRAIELFEARFGSAAPDLGRLYASKAANLANLSRYQEAEVAIRRALELRGSLLPPNHGWMMNLQTLLASVLDALGRSTEAAELFEQTVATQRQSFGPNHPELAQTLVKYGYFLTNQGQLRKSEAVFQEALAILEKEKHYDEGSVLRYLGFAVMGEHRWQDGADYLARADRLFAEKLAPGHPVRVASGTSMGLAYLRLGKLREGEELLNSTIAAIERAEGPDSYNARAPLSYLGEIYRLQGRIDEAMTLHRRCRELAIAMAGSENHAGVCQADYVIAFNLIAAPVPDLPGARLALDRSCAWARENLPDGPRNAECLLVSALLALREGNRPRAEREAAAGLAWSREHFGDDSPLTADAEEVVARVQKNDRGGRIPPWGPSDGHSARAGRRPGATGRKPRI